MIKGRNVKFFRILFVISLICIGSRGVLAEPYDLAELGAILPSIIVDAENVSVNLKVNLANDEALRTFVMAHTAAGSVYKETI
jgi:hypothetical protein